MKPKRNWLRAIVLSHLGRLKGSLFLAGLCMLGFTLAELAWPWPLKLIFDHILLDEPLSWPLLAELIRENKVSALILLSLSIIVLALLRGLFAYFQLFLTSRIGYQLVHRLRCELFAHLQRLSLSFHNRERSGDLLTKVVTDSDALRDVFAESALTSLAHLLTIFGMFAIMFSLDWFLSLIVLATFPVLFFGLFYLYRKVKSSAKSQRSKEGKVAARIAEILTNLPLIQAFGRERFEEERFESESARTLTQSIRTARLGAAVTRAVEIISAFGTWAVVLFGSLQVINGRMTPGAILVFAAYVADMYRPIRRLARTSARFSKAMASAERISNILDVEPEVKDTPGAIEACAIHGEIEFDRVSFDYSDTKPVLRDVSFRVAAGQRVALVGASGAGKSTIISLLLRLYDPRQGSIRLDGVELARYRRESLRREIAIVPQDPLLFAASARENIAYGKPHATAEEVEAAATAANAHGFICALPEGYDTQLGERGAVLSGGQRQRIAIARAIVRRAPIIILDEPLTGLDPASAAAVMQALERLIEHKTVLMITHQLSSLEEGEYIIVLDEGRIVQQGTHSELMDAGGKYRRLFASRSPGSRQPAGSAQS